MIERRQSWASSEGIRRSMVANRGRDTSPELNLRRELHARGLRFFVNRRPVPGLKRTADVVFPRSRIAVFVDGCFWHGCPVHYTAPRTNGEYWAAKVNSNRERDIETTRALELEGWRVIRIWEHESVESAARLVEHRVRPSL